MDNDIDNIIISFPSFPAFTHITSNRSLSGDEKNLLNLIFSLSIKHGYSFANNDYLAKIIGKSESATAILLTRLKTKGLINIIENSKKKRERKITLPNLEKFSQYSKKTLDALTPEPELVEGIIEDEKPVDKYAHFVPEKKAPRATTIINIANVTLTPKMREYAQNEGYSVDATEHIFKKFLSYNKSRSSRSKDWDETFNLFMLKEKERDKKNFSNAPAQARPSSSSPTVGERIGLENSLLADHDTFSREMVRRGIHPYMILEKTTTLPQEFCWLGIMTISTLKGGVQKIWYDTRKYNQQQSCDDIITVEVIEHKGENNAYYSTNK
jgi:hypothetical protein